MTHSPSRRRVVAFPQWTRTQGLLTIRTKAINPLLLSSQIIVTIQKWAKNNNLPQAFHCENCDDVGGVSVVGHAEKDREREGLGL